MSASRWRKEGREAYCEGDDPETVCPYKSTQNTYARNCWIEGFMHEQEWQLKLREEELQRQDDEYDSQDWDFYS